MDDDALAIIQHIAAGIDAMYAEFEMQDARRNRQGKVNDIQNPGRDENSGQDIGITLLHPNP
jgi:hypothetical protein